MVKFMDVAGLSRLNAELAAVACPPGGDTVVTCTAEVYSCKATTSDKRVSHSLEQRMGAVAAAAATDEWATRHTLPSASLSAHLRKVLIYLVLVLNATFPDYDFTGAATALPEAFDTYTVAEVQARVDAALEEVYRYVDAESTGSAMSFDEAPEGAIAEASPSQRPTPANVAASRGDGDRRASRPRADRASHRKRKRGLVAAGAATTTTALPTRNGGGDSASDGRTPSPRPLSLVAPPRSSAHGMRERLWAALHEAINLPACEAYAYEGLSDGDGPFHEPGVLWSFNYFLYNHAWRRVAFLRCVAVKVPSPVLASPAPSEGAVSAVRPIPVAHRPARRATSEEVEVAGEGAARRAADAPASPRWHDPSLIFDLHP